jgi:flagellar biosynthesis component FlhA
MFLFPIALILSNKLRFFSTGKMVTQIYPLGHFLIAIAQWFLIAWSVRLWLKSKSLEMMVLPIILISLTLFRKKSNLCRTRYSLFEDFSDSGTAIS